MRFTWGLAAAVAVILATPVATEAQETARAVEGGGIFAAGWQGQIDASEEKAGQTLKNAKLTGDGKVLQIATGPAVVYWNPANTASGDYTVKATFTEPKYMNVNDHPHPYGIVIAGHEMGTPQQVRRVIDIVRKEKIPVVFSESTVSDKPARQVAKEARTRYGGVLYVDSLSGAGGPVPSYLKLLEVTVQTIVEGFGS